MQKLTVSVGQACEISSLSPRTVQRMIARGDLETVKLGDRRLIVLESLRELITLKKTRGES